MPRNSVDFSEAVFEAIKASSDRIAAALSGELSVDTLENYRKEVDENLESDLENGNWVKTYKGRDILKNFCNNHVQKVGYEVFRDLTISCMESDKFEPVGMKSIFDVILDSELE